MRTTALAAAALLAVPLVAACTSDAGTQTTVVETTTTEDACGAADYQQFVGQHSPEISVPAGTAMRHYRTGDPLTMDMRIDRLNFEYDRSGRLVAVTCG